MWVSRYLVLFVIVSFLGWVYETLYALIRRHKWENRGFLYSPICPIYGVGALLLIGICRVLTGGGVEKLEWWEVFLISCVGSMVLEYITSWVLEKLFHARWWDYSNMPLNIQGRICLPAALAFGVAGLLMAYYIVPFVNNIINAIPPIWIEVISLLLTGWLMMDFTLTVSALTNFEKRILQLNERINNHMDTFVEGMKGRKQPTANAIAKERERFTRENIKQVFQDGSLGLKRTLYKLRRYNHPKIEAKSTEQIIKEVKKFWKRK